MIALIRRLFVIALLFGLLFFIDIIQVDTTTIINSKSLAVLGFIILASFAAGEIFRTFKLPSVLAYLITGIIFGPFSGLIFQTNLLQIIVPDVLIDLRLVTQVTLAVIALLAGMELKLERIKAVWSRVSLLSGIQIIIMLLVFPAAMFLVVQLIDIPEYGWRVITGAGLLLGILALSTSAEVSFTTAAEINQKNRFADTILYTAIIKDVLIIILLSVIFLFNNNSELRWDLAGNLLSSAGTGVLLGLVVLLYLKYIRKEILVFILSIVIIGSQFASSMNAQILLLFIIMGFIITNYSLNEKLFSLPLEKLSYPVFVIFFTIAGASLNIGIIHYTITAALLITVLRILAIYISVKLASRISGSKDKFSRYGWTGFISTGVLVITLASYLENFIPGTGSILRDVIITYAGINILLGPALYKIGLRKGAKYSAQPETLSAPEPEIQEKQHVKLSSGMQTKFNDPDFRDETLNHSVMNILIKISNVIKSFERKIIYERNEDSLEFIILVTEKYSEEYFKLKNTIVKPGLSALQITNEILHTKKNLAEWYYTIAEERKNVEKKIADLEPYVNELFISFSDITDGLNLQLTVELEPEKFTFNENDTAAVRLRKVIYQLRLRVMRFFDEQYKLTRTINYKNLAKYFLVGKSAGELLQAVNLVGHERLITLRKIRALYSDINKYFDELINVVNEERDTLALSTILLERMELVHQQFVNEINIHSTEINRTGDEIRDRLHYALANPFNEFLEQLKIAGTYEFNESRYRFSKIFNQSEHDKNLALQSVKYWINHYLGLLGISQKEALIIGMNVDIHTIVQNTLLSISEQINKDLRLFNSDLTRTLRAFRRNLGQSQNGTDNITELITNTEGNITGTLNNHIEELENIRKSKKLNFVIGKLINEFLVLSEALPEKLYVLEEKDFVTEGIPQFVELKPVRIKSLSKSVLERKLPRDLGEINELLLNHLNFTLNELKNVRSVVNYHLNTIHAELEGSGKRAKSTAADLSLELVEKLNYRVEKINQQVDRLEATITKKITEILDNVVSEIYALLHSSLQSMSLFLMREDKKNLFLKSTKSAWGRARDIFRRVYVVSRRRIKQLIQYLAHMYTINFRSEKYASRNLYESTTNYELDESRLKNLPFIYRKLFDGSPLETADFFVQREEIYGIVHQAINGFRTGKQSSIVLIGDPGSGKSSIVNTISSDLLNDVEYIRYSFDSTAYREEDFRRLLSGLLNYDNVLTGEELLANFLDRTQRKAVILEDIHKLFLKVVGGYEGIEFLIKLISLTGRNTLWVCSVNKHAWNLLNANYNLSEIFQHKIDTENLPQKDIRSIILNRHTATGFDLRFHSAEYQNNIFKRDSKKEQEFLRNDFFRRLREYSEGNILSAMYYWLKSIRSVENNLIVMNPIRKINLEILHKLDIYSALSIANILQHGWLSADEHSAIFNFDIEQSMEILTSLASTNLIYLDQIEIESRKFFINKFLYKQIEKELVKRNIL